MEKGLDLTRGGALYNSTGVQLIGFANVVDSLRAIEKAVFECVKRVSLNRRLIFCKLILTKIMSFFKQFVQCLADVRYKGNQLQGCQWRECRS